LPVDRRALIVYIFPDTTNALNIFAMEGETHAYAYEIVEQAVLNRLAQNRSARKR
jgi:hypothetical protein